MRSCEERESISSESRGTLDLGDALCVGCIEELQVCSLMVKLVDGSRGLMVLSEYGVSNL